MWWSNKCLGKEDIRCEWTNELLMSLGWMGSMGV